MHYLRKTKVINFIVGGTLGLILALVGDASRSEAMTQYPKWEYETETVTVVELETELVAEPEPIYDVPLSEELQGDIQDLCTEYDFDYALALAIIKTESSFDTDVIGDNGQATGLCQIWSYWWGDLASERGLDINKPADNVEMMLVIMTGHLEEHTLTEALQMYNTGKPDGNEYAQRVYSNLELIKERKNVCVDLKVELY